MRPLFSKNRFPALVAHTHEIAVIAKVEEFGARTFVYLSTPVGQHVVAIEMYLGITFTKGTAFADLLLKVNITQCCSNGWKPIHVADDAVRA